jgi:hypothetical protein
MAATHSSNVTKELVPVNRAKVNSKVAASNAAAVHKQTALRSKSLKPERITRRKPALGAKAKEPATPNASKKRLN